MFGRVFWVMLFTFAFLVMCLFLYVFYWVSGIISAWIEVLWVVSGKWGFCIFQLNVSVIGLSSALVRYFRAFPKESQSGYSCHSLPFHSLHFICSSFWGIVCTANFAVSWHFLFLFVCHHIFVENIHSLALNLSLRPFFALYAVITFF